MHYTSIENIHKVIDPLFLDGLRGELEEIKRIPIEKRRKSRALNFQRRIASLRFLDSACGSGNFLTETYISLRRVENGLLSLVHQGQIVMDVGNPIQVSIGQFYGIEINNFAVTVAKTALWIAESQMMRETEAVVHMPLDFLPHLCPPTLSQSHRANRLREYGNRYMTDLGYILILPTGLFAGTAKPV